MIVDNQRSNQLAPLRPQATKVTLKESMKKEPNNNKTGSNRLKKAEKSIIPVVVTISVVNVICTRSTKMMILNV